jgi:alpha/beta superfamily hydrolase
MKTTEVRFPSGELLLEGVLGVPEGVLPFPAVVVCHPHPLYGGSMDNRVVNAVCKRLVQNGIAALKFNFRGVGGSQGEHGGGKDEGQDVAAAIDYISGLAGADVDRIGLVGYSAGFGYGAPVGIGDERVRVLVGISPPLALFDFTLLKGCPKPHLLVSGDKDDLLMIESFRRFCRSLGESGECHTIEGADHFWQGYEEALAERVVAFLARALKE